MTPEQNEDPVWVTRYPLTNRKRDVVRVKKRSESFSGKSTVFIGIFNGSNYLSGIQIQLGAQSNKNVDVLIVDNCSKDRSWKEISALSLTEFRGSVTLVRNSVNCGATGSFYANIDLVCTEWVTFWHQDDIYLFNHIEVLNDGVRAASKGVVSVSTRMGNRDSKGKILTTPPRALELVDYKKPAQALAATIKNHLIPWPCSAFKVEALIQAESPWHSSSFHDTEISMHLILLGELEFIDVETMLYTENPLSGSHELTNSERTLGVFLAIQRFICSSKFLTFLKSLPRPECENSLREISSSIQTRIKEEPYCSLLLASLYESAAFALRYESVFAGERLSGVYAKLGGSTTAMLLRDLILDSNYPGGLSGKSSDRQPINKVSFNSNTEQEPKGLTLPTHLRAAVWSWLARTNRPLALLAVKVYSRVFKVDSWKL